MAASRQLSLYPSSMTTAEWADIEPAVRNSAFFSATVEDERLLAALQKLVETGLSEGWSTAVFIDNALQMLENISLDPEARTAETFREDFETLYDSQRLRLIFQTQAELAHGYKQFQEAFSPMSLQVYPGWKFVRQPGAKEEYKRFDHVRTENFIRLKTDLKFWLRRNRREIGGFENPYTPWGFNSKMRTQPVNRKTCEELGLLKKGQKVVIPAEYSQWGISTAVQGMGKAGAADLSSEQKNNVKKRCQDEGIKVEEKDNTLQIIPDKENPEDTLTQLQEKEANAWLEDEMRRLNELSAEELLNELLNE